VCIWDMVDGSSRVFMINDDDGSDCGITSVTISPNGHLLAAGFLAGRVHIWDIATGILVDCLYGHGDGVYSVAFTPDGKGLVSGSLDKTLKYWDVTGLMTGGVKGRKKGAHGGLAVRSETINVPDGVARKDGETGSHCSMTLSGHKVCHCNSSQFGSLTLVACRTMLSVWPFHIMASGWYQDPRTELCISGIHNLGSCNVCFVDIRTLVHAM